LWYHFDHFSPSNSTVSQLPASQERSSQHRLKRCLFQRIKREQRSRQLLTN